MNAGVQTRHRYSYQACTNSIPWIQHITASIYSGYNSSVTVQCEIMLEKRLTLLFQNSILAPILFFAPIWCSRPLLDSTAVHLSELLYLGSSLLASMLQQLVPGIIHLTYSFLRGYVPCGCIRLLWVVPNLAREISTRQMLVCRCDQAPSSAEQMAKICRGQWCVC